MNIKMKNYLIKLNDFKYSNELFYINIIWFTSWLFCFPLLLNINNEYNYRNYYTIYYFILLPSILRHAHIKYINEYISFLEKWLVIIAVMSIFLRRINYLLSNNTLEVINYYDIGVFGSVFYDSYIYFVLKLSFSRYGTLWHSSIHLAGTIGFICVILSY